MRTSRCQAYGYFSHLKKFCSPFTSGCYPVAIYILFCFPFSCLWTDTTLPESDAHHHGVRPMGIWLKKNIITVLLPLFFPFPFTVKPLTLVGCALHGVRPFGYVPSSSPFSNKLQAYAHSMVTINHKKFPVGSAPLGVGPREYRSIP